MGNRAAKSSLTALKQENKRKIIQQLRKTELYSSDLAKALKLSTAGVASLVDEMVADELLIKKDASKVVRGRRPLNLSINPEKGIVAVVKIKSASIYYLIISDFSGRIIFNEKKTALLDLIEDIKFNLKTVVNDINKKLYSISFAASGKINKKTGGFHFWPSFGKYQNENFVSIFEKEFNVKVIMKNALIFAHSAEINSNSALSKENILFLQDLGSSLFLNGMIYEGYNGFAGEIGLLNIDIYSEASEYQLHNPYRSNLFLSAYSGMCELAKEKHKDLFDENAPEIHGRVFELYAEGLPEIKSIVKKYLHILALTIRNIVEYLDLSCLIISGHLMKLTDEDMALLASFINETAMDKLDLLVMRANIKDADIQGAISYALDAAFEALI